MVPTSSTRMSLCPTVILFLASDGHLVCSPLPGSVQMPDYSSYTYPQYAGYAGYNYSSAAGGLLSK